MNYLIQKRKEILSNIDFSLLYIVMSSILVIMLIQHQQSEVVILEEEYFDNNDELVVEESFTITPGEIVDETTVLTTESYINSLISTLNRKCSSSVMTHSRIIYYIKWDNIDELWRANPTGIKEELNKLSSTIEGIWHSHGVNKSVELVLDSQLYDKALAVSTNGRITFSTY